jgi:uncharacterized membrane protein YbhN (UPF0104 family)
LARTAIAARPPARRWLTALVRLGVASAVLGALFSAISFDDVLNAVASAEAAPLIGAIGLGLGAQFSSAVRLRPVLATQGIAAARSGLFQINLATLFYGLFLPAGNLAGIAIRFYKMASRHRKYAGIALTSCSIASWRPSLCAWSA